MEDVLGHQRTGRDMPRSLSVRSGSTDVSERPVDVPARQGYSQTLSAAATSSVTDDR